MSMEQKRLRAAPMLVVANAAWGLSFPTMKSVVLLQQPLLPHSSSWFIAALAITLRFGFAALIMLAVCAPTLRRLTRLEVWEGLGLAVLGGAGLLFQMDGLACTAASTSAFLTQFYCVLIPLWVATQERRWPSFRTVGSCLMVVVGVAVLSEMDWRSLRLGRGELETLIASTIFTGQILWLQRPRFARNNVNRFTLVMFAGTALGLLPVALATASPSDNWLAAYQPPAAWCFLGILVTFCTLGAYVLMNYWQPCLTATQAGLLYCLEPVFASAFALFLPAWFSVLGGLYYSNERLGWSLIVGGGLITLANVLIQTGVSTPPSERLPGPSLAAMPEDQGTAIGDR